MNMMKKPGHPVFAAVAASMLAVVLALAPSRAARADDTLYRALGGRDGIAKIVEDLALHLLADPRTKDYFVNAPERRIAQKLEEQFCVLAGGPCTYTGRPMKRSHAGEQITTAAFNAFMEDLRASMNDARVPPDAQDALLALLAPMYHDIVEEPTPDAS